MTTSHHLVVAVAIIASGCFDSRSETQGCAVDDYCHPRDPLLELNFFGENVPLVSDAGELLMEGPFCTPSPVVCGNAVPTGASVSVAVPFGDKGNVDRRLTTSDAGVIEVREPSFDCLAVSATLVAHRPGTAKIALVRAVDRVPTTLDTFTLRVEDADHIEIRPVFDDDGAPLEVDERELYSPSLRAADGTVLATLPATVAWRTSDANVIAVEGDLNGLLVSVRAVGAGVAELVAETDAASGSLTLEVE